MRAFTGRATRLSAGATPAWCRAACSVAVASAAGGGGAIALAPCAWSRSGACAGVRRAGPCGVIHPPGSHRLAGALRRAGYSARRAVVIGSRAARSAGNSPPTRPMPSAHFSPLHSSAGETLNWNTTWLKLLPSVDTL